MVKVLDFVQFGGAGGNRTHDLRVKSPLLCQLSYGPAPQDRHPASLTHLNKQGCGLHTTGTVVDVCYGTLFSDHLALKTPRLVVEVMQESTKEGSAGDWWRVLRPEDAANLSVYSRPRPPFSGVSPTLLVVDVTEAFVGPNLPVAEAQEQWRQACGEKAWAAMPAIRSLLAAFRTAGRPVIFTTPDGSQRWTGSVTRGTTASDIPKGREVVPEVAPLCSEWVLRKPKASAFFGTPLVSSLIRGGCDTLVVAGGTTSGCVRATAVDGFSHGFEIMVAEDGCFDRATLNHLVNLADLDAKYARVLPASKILSLLGFH